MSSLCCKNLRGLRSCDDEFDDNVEDVEELMLLGVMLFALLLMVMLVLVLL